MLSTDAWPQTVQAREDAGSTLACSMQPAHMGDLSCIHHRALLCISKDYRAKFNECSIASKAQRHVPPWERAAGGMVRRRETPMYCPHLALLPRAWVMPEPVRNHTHRCLVQSPLQRVASPAQSSCRATPCAAGNTSGEDVTEWKDWPPALLKPAHSC